MRPPGTADKLHRPGIRTVNKIAREVERRAREGSVEDQRAMLEYYLGVTHRPPKPVPGLLSPLLWPVSSSDEAH